MSIESEIFDRLRALESRVAVLEKRTGVTTLTVEPGEVLTLKLAHSPSSEEYKNICEGLKKTFGPDVKFIIVVDGAELGKAKVHP